MAGAFSIEKMKSYVEETEDYVLPLCKFAKNHYPQYSDQIFAMRYFIESINKAVKTFVGMIENKKETSKNLEVTLSIIVEVQTTNEELLKKQIRAMM